MGLSTDSTYEPHTVCASISHAGSKVNSSKGKFFHYLELCKECKTLVWILLVAGPLGCVTQGQQRILLLYANSSLITSHKSELLEEVALCYIRARIIWEQTLYVFSSVNVGLKQFYLAKDSTLCKIRKKIFLFSYQCQMTHSKPCFRSLCLRLGSLHSS